MATEASFVVRREHAARLIALAQRLGNTAPVPLYRAVVEGWVRLVQHDRGTQIGRAVLNDTRPTVVVLGDDEYLTAGPGGWPQAVRLLRWAEIVILHGASADPVHYAMAAAGAMLRRRALLVETSSAHLNLWIELTDKVARAATHVTVVAMAPGHVHPRRSAPPGATLQ